MTPPRTFTNVVFEGLRGTPRAGAEPKADRITWETIQAVRPDGRYLVLGQVLATTGQKIYRLGDRVPVAWVDGRPTVIFGHSWRRAQFHEVVVIEEVRLEALFIGTVQGGTETVFIATERGVFVVRQAGSDPQDLLLAVGWGRNPNIILVDLLKGPDQTTRVFQVLRIKRGAKSARMPVTKETIAGLPVVDTDLVGEFLAVPNLVIPGTFQANATVEVRHVLNVQVIEDFPFNPSQFQQSTFYHPLASRADQRQFNATVGTLNLDGSLAQDVLESAPFLAYVDEADHLIVVYELT